MKKILILLLVTGHWSLVTAFAETGTFDTDRWYGILHDVQNRAVAENISPAIINDVIQPSVFIPAIVRHDKNQAEFKLTLDAYLARMINDKRVATGRAMREKYPTMLARVEHQYGVQPHVIMAFWGLESNYGEYKARYKLTDAFLTLMYDGRRQQFFDKQLFALMKHADAHDIEIGEIRGSWAGAMGHFQFIPTTLEQYGADGNGDGKIDIINSIGDAMFSAGNYLNKLGWNGGEKIVRRVTLPAGFDTSFCDGKTKKNLVEWRAMGINAPDANMTAGLVCDSGLAYLTYPNFYRIKKWNNSNWYAIAIAELADELY